MHPSSHSRSHSESAALTNNIHSPPVVLVSVQSIRVRSAIPKRDKSADEVIRTIDILLDGASSKRGELGLEAILLNLVITKERIGSP